MRRKIRFASSSWQIASSDSMSFSHSPSISTVQRPRRRTGYALLRRFLQRLDQLLELGLVGEGDFQTIRHDSAGEAGHPLGRDLRRGPRGPDRAWSRAARCFVRAPAQRAARSAARTDMPLLDDLPGELRGGPRGPARRAPRAHGPRSARRARPSRARRRAARAAAGGSRPPASSGRPARRPRRARARTRRCSTA